MGATERNFGVVMREDGVTVDMLKVETYREAVDEMLRRWRS